MKLFISPHNDDETLFGAFTIMREKPLVIVVYDSYVQVQRGHKECDAVTRRGETFAALQELYGVQVPPVRFLGFNDAGNYVAMTIAEQIRRTLGGAEPEVVYAPACEAGGHKQHNLVSTAALELGGLRRWYTTYTEAGKTRTENTVPVESGEWIIRKMRALSCYKTQIMNPQLGCQPHFAADLLEYYA